MCALVRWRGFGVHLVFRVAGWANVRRAVYNNGATAAGWFIERDEDAQAAPAADMSADEADAIIRAASGTTTAPVEPAAYTTPSPTQTVFQTAPPPPTGGQVDFEAVFDSAGVDA